MHSLSVVIAQKENATAQQLAQTLRSRFRQVLVAHSIVEIVDCIAKNHAQSAIIDLEAVTAEELRQLCREFPGTAVVATHRSPDDEMWMETLSLGAVDCCHFGDVETILRAISHNVVLTRARAA
jgi:DNA-binding NarL/FixJ family response regulator